MSIESLARDGWVLEVWYDPEGPAGQRFACLASKGGAIEVVRGCGRSAEAAAGDAVRNCLERQSLTDVS